MNKEIIIALIVAGSISASTFAWFMWNIANIVTTTAGNVANNNIEQFREQIQWIKSKIQWIRSKINTVREDYYKAHPEVKQTQKEFTEAQAQLNKLQMAKKKIYNDIVSKYRWLTNWEAIAMANKQWRVLDEQIFQATLKVNTAMSNYQYNNSIAQQTISDKYKIFESQLSRLTTVYNSDVSQWLVLLNIAEAKRVAEAKRTEMQTKAKEMRNNFKQVRTQFKDSREVLVVKWKKIIVSKLSARVDKMSLARLEKIETRIDNAVPKLENRKDLSENSKTEIISALDALKQVVDARIAQLKAQSAFTTDNTMNVLGNILWN